MTPEVHHGGNVPIKEGNVPESTQNVTAQPFRTKRPEQVHLRINNINTVVSWQDFISLLNCCHEFESNIYPTRARSGAVEIHLL